VQLLVVVVLVLTVLGVPVAEIFMPTKLAAVTGGEIATILLAVQLVVWLNKHHDQ
jgi:preprotein translocase subunit SecF